MTIRIGLLGASNIAPTAVIAPSADWDQIEVAAVAARESHRGQQYAQDHGIKRVFDSYQELIADPNIDVVYVATPASLHGTWTRRALEAGKHVLVEKPFTANAAEAEAIREAAEKTGHVVMEAMHSLYHPLWSEAADIISSGEIGEVTEARANFEVPIMDRSDIRWNPALGGGALMDLGVYPLTLVKFLFGDLELQSAEAKDIDGVDYFLQGCFRTEGGAPVTIVTQMDEAAASGPGTEEQILTVKGTEGTLTLDTFVHPQNGGELRVTTPSGSRVSHAEGLSSYSLMLGALVQAIEGGVPVPTDPEAAVDIMKDIDALYRLAGLEPRQPTLS